MSLIVISSYSTDLQTSTVSNDSFYVKVLYSRIVKANQALTEIPHRRFQVEQLEKYAAKKDSVIAKLLAANKVCHQVNTEYAEQEAALKIKSGEFESLFLDYKAAEKKASNRGLALKITTPVIIISVAILAGVGGYYLAKVIK